jgi:multidrug efflux pump
MDQITGALIGIALVLSAVFVPMAFFGGSTGAIYRQFSLTIVSAMVLSVLVALILTPALCATLLKPVKKGEHIEKRGFFGWFNRFFERNADRYRSGVGYILKRTGRFSLVYLLLIGGMVFFFTRLPTSFIPEEDQGVFLTMVQLPAGATLERTRRCSMGARSLPDQRRPTSVRLRGRRLQFRRSGQNTGMVFAQLRDWKERKDPATVGKCHHRQGMVPFPDQEAMVFAFNIPAIRPGHLDRASSSRTGAGWAMRNCWRPGTCCLAHGRPESRAPRVRPAVWKIPAVQCGYRL